MSGERSVARGAAATVVGVVVAMVSVWIWVAVNASSDAPLLWLALPIGPAIGLAMFAVRGRHTSWVPVTAALITLVSMLTAQNFLQRELLYDGIDALQEQWDEFQVAAPSAIEETDDLTELDAEDVAGVIPPPEIVAVMPAEAFELMEPAVLAAVWDDIPPDVLEAIDPELRAEAEEILAGGEEAGSGSLTLEEARERYADSEEEYDIPQAVAECATIPDFTQPDAAHGMGFGDGVPLVLPLDDLISDPPPRGDGIDAEQASPFCFASEHAKEEPVELFSWLGSIALAFAVPFALGRRRDDGEGEDAVPTTDGNESATTRGV